MANPIGRPPMYKTPEEMQVIIDDYFENDAWFDNDGKREFRPTISGLALTLDLSTKSLRNYEIKPEFLPTVNKAKLKVEMALENHLYGSAVTGAIFNLKNNFGWRDQHQVDNTSSDGSMSPTKIEVLPVETSSKST